jgi:N-methylhydantoinase B
MVTIEDPVAFELMRSGIEAVADEMAVAVVRTAFSSNVHDGMDFAVAICDAEGQVVAQGLSIPLLLGSIESAMKGVLLKFPSGVGQGDVVVMNDPYAGGQHLPDLFIVAPVYVHDALVGYFVTVTDHVDIGGRYAGGRSLEAKEIYEEGLRLPAVKLLEAGHEIAAVWDIVTANVRLPEIVLGDIRACLAAQNAARNALTELVERFGVETYRDFLTILLDYTEQVARERISEMAVGSADFVDYLDDSIVAPEQLEIRVSVRSDGASLSFDFAGTSASVEAAINSNLAFTTSAVYACVRTLMPIDLPNNAGLFRLISVTAPVGCIANAQHPSAVSSRGVVGLRVVDCVRGALAQLFPSMVPAAGEGGTSSIRISGRKASGALFIAFDSVNGTWGARPTADGIDGCRNFAANGGAAVPVEIIEAESPLRITRFALRQDSGGAGLYRGGCGLERQWEVLTDEVVMTIRADRAKTAPWGLAGGGDGAMSRNSLLRDGVLTEKPSKAKLGLRHGDIFTHQQAGGGGYGDPLNRDPNAVLSDWTDDFVSLEAAKSLYGVVIDAATRKVVSHSTRELRRRLRDEREIAR